MTPSRFTKIKITLGYMLLLVALLSGLFFIRKEMKHLSNSGHQQGLMTDSLLLLLGEKDESVLQLIQLMNKANEQVLTTDEIEKIVAEQDSVFTQQRVHKTIVTKHDTIVAQPPKKKFFRRVADVFSPSKKDTAVTVNTTYEVYIDTLLQATNPADSLHQRILKVNEKNKAQRKAAAQRNTAYFKQLNAELTARMDSIMQSYEENIAHQAMVMAEREQTVRQRSTEILGGIAIGAIALTIIFVIIMWRDLSRSNRYRKQLEEANRRAEELLVTREKLMLAITHDIKAPLSSIIGYLDLLQQSVNNEQDLGYIHNMESSSTHLLKLVTDLLDFHRLDLNKMEVNRESFNPTHLFQELENIFTPLVSAKHLHFEVTINPVLDGLYISDSLRLRQIVTNLLSNAIKFTPKGTISLLADYHSSQLIVKVKDTGLGMQPEQTKIIFQEFTRLPQAQGEEGFGLGLSIVHKLITLLEGTIDIESTPGEGSQFTIKIPLYPVAGQSEKKEPKGTTLPQNEHKPLRVLMIDDDKMQLTLTAELLSRQGIDSVCCTQLNDLLDELRSKQFDMLLTDVQMPAISGFDLLKLLRSSNIHQAKEIPIVAVTARSDMKTEEFIEKGFTGCLYKPFSVNELMKLFSLPSYTVKNTNEEPSKETNKSQMFQFEQLTAFTQGDVETTKNILTTFIEETIKDIAQIEEGLSDNNTTLIAAKAHKLLPLFIMMKSSELVSLLKYLESIKGKTVNKEIKDKIERTIHLLHFCLDETQKYLIGL